VPQQNLVAAVETSHDRRAVYRRRCGRVGAGSSRRGVVGGRLPTDVRRRRARTTAGPRRPPPATAATSHRVGGDYLRTSGGGMMDKTRPTGTLRQKDVGQ